MRAIDAWVFRAVLPCAVAIGATACGRVGSGETRPIANPNASSQDDSSRTRKGPPIETSISLARDDVPHESDLEISVVIENHSQDQVVLLAEELTSPAALFEVRDAYGQKMLPTSPPVPTGGKKVVEPGHAIDIKMTLAGMFSPPLKPGEYSVRLRRIDSSPRRFRISGR